MTATKNYTVRTDAFLCDDIEAESLAEAIEVAFDGEDSRIKDEASLYQRFEARYVPDGGWCWIDCDGERIVEIGDCP